MPAHGGFLPFCCNPLAGAVPLCNDSTGLDDPFGISPFGIMPVFSSQDWDLGQRDVLGGSCKFAVSSYTISRQSSSCRYLGLSLGFCERRV